MMMNILGGLVHAPKNSTMLGWLKLLRRQGRCSLPGVCRDGSCAELTA